MKFKVGDRIRLLPEAAQYLAAKAGAEAEVTETSSYLKIEWDKSTPALRELACSQSNGLYYETQFELVTPAPPTDEELAQTLRDAYKTYVDSIKELKDRGWDIKPLSSTKVVIQKTTTSTL